MCADVEPEDERVVALEELAAGILGALIVAVGLVVWVRRWETA